MLFTPNFSKVGRKKSESEQCYGPFCSHGRVGSASKAGMASSSHEKFKVRHCNTKATVTELIIVIIVILLGDGVNCNQNLYGNLYGRTQVHGQLALPGQLKQAGLGERNTYSQSHNNEISRAWLQEETGQRR